VTGSTRTPVIRRVLINSAPSAGTDGPCPVVCTATGRLCDAANSTAARTSATSVAPTINTGRCWTLWLKPAHSASYP
jgi:hypothetical protein